MRPLRTLATPVLAPPSSSPTSRHVAFRAFSSEADFATGTHQGTRVHAGRLRYGAPAGLLHHTDPRPDGPVGREYEWVAWMAPEVTPGFDFTSLVASWNAATPDDSWLHVEARVSVDGVRWSRWYSLGTWAETDAEIHRASRTGQHGDTGRVAIDVLDATPGTSWSTYQLRVVLARRPGSTAVASLRLLGAMVSRLPDDAGETSRTTIATGTELPVPRYSQQLHRDSHPEWANGGEAWCSPSSTAMVLDHWGVGPGPADYAWVPHGSPNPAVVHAVRNVFDYGYGGAGNWSFNAAYAARFGVVAFVTRLRSLVEAERLVGAGIPVVASVAFDEEQLTGAGYGTDGHLLTIIGFTATGDVVCNDPASHELPSNDEVRVVYDRAEFERVWLGSAGGAVYVIHPDGVPLPPPAVPTEPNW